MTSVSLAKAEERYDTDIEHDKYERDSIYSLLVRAFGCVKRCAKINHWGMNWDASTTNNSPFRKENIRSKVNFSIDTFGTVGAKSNPKM